MTPDEWRRLTPAQQTAHVARYGPPPPQFLTTPASYGLGSAAPRRYRRWPWIASGVVAVLFVLGVTTTGRSASPSATAGSTPTATARPVAEQAAAAPTTLAPQPAPVASANVGDGTYQIGTDVAAGRYKTAGPGGSGPLDLCYWARLKNDSGDFNAIISNNLVRGPGSVTLKKGEFIEFTGGCSWTRQ